MVRKITKSAAVMTILSFISISNAGDWSQWRYDGFHSATTSEQLPSDLQLQWVREEGKPVPAWDNQKEVDSYGGPGKRIAQRVGFDIAHQPVVSGQTAFFNSVNSDKVVAVDLATGSEKWSFFANGPIRFAPAVKNGKVYFGSDDGYLYCVNALNGALIWKYQAGPDSRTVMGNDRLISKWCVRGAPVLPNGELAFDAPGLSAWLQRMRSATNEYTIMTASDDMEEKVATGAIDGGSSDLEFNYESTGSGSPQIVGLRFQSEFLRIPQGSLIDSAFIQLGVDETKGGTAPCTLLIEGEASGNSAPFTTSSYMLSSRAKTQTSVIWTPGSWTSVGQNSLDQRTPDIKSIIQEIINRSDWVKDAPLTIMVKGIGGDGIRCADASDENQITAKLLVYSRNLDIDSVSNRPQPTTVTNPDSNLIYIGSGLYPF
jgi:hypothetical protein